MLDSAIRVSLRFLRKTVQKRSWVAMTNWQLLLLFTDLSSICLHDQVPTTEPVTSTFATNPSSTSTTGDGTDSSNETTDTTNTTPFTTATREPLFPTSTTTTSASNTTIASSGESLKRFYSLSITDILSFRRCELGTHSWSFIGSRHSLSSCDHRWFDLLLQKAQSFASQANVRREQQYYQSCYGHSSRTSSNAEKTDRQYFWAVLSFNRIKCHVQEITGVIIAVLFVCWLSASENLVLIDLKRC